MRLKYFLEYRFDDASGGFLPIGVWMHNPTYGDVDIFHLDPECPEADEGNWVLNRLVEGGFKTPEDFLEYHATRAGYRGMRGPMRETETDLNYTTFAEKVMQDALAKDNHVANQ